MMKADRLLYWGLSLVAAGLVGSAVTSFFNDRVGAPWFMPFSGLTGMMVPGTAPNVAPLAPEAAKSAAKRYLAKLGNADLAVREVMVFSNSAYLAVVERSSGVGAFELLVDPASMAVTPEPGPNMMWNLKYSPMAGMMGGAKAGSGDMINASQATQAAQRYIDATIPGVKAAEDAQRFYGYYTLDIERDGHPIGMLSLHGYTHAVFFHHWHGTFVSETQSC